MSENVRFEPKPEQLKFAEIYLDLSRKTITELAKEVGVSDRTIYRWFKDKDFVSWLNSKKDEILNRSLMAIYKTAIRKAIAGDFKFSKMLFEMQGEYTRKSKSKVTKVYDENDNMTTEELINEFEQDLNRYKTIIANNKKENYLTDFKSSD